VCTLRAYIVVLNRRLLFSEQVLVVVGALCQFRAADRLHCRTWLLLMNQGGSVLRNLMAPKRAHELYIVCVTAMASHHGSLRIQHFPLHVDINVQLLASVNACLWRVIHDTLFVNRRLALHFRHIDVVIHSFIGWRRDIVHLDS